MTKTSKICRVYMATFHTYMFDYGLNLVFSSPITKELHGLGILIVSFIVSFQIVNGPI